MLEVRDLHAWYGKSHVLHGVTLDVRAGEIVSLLGRNGVGRSTTVKAIMGQVAAKGEVRFRGRELDGACALRDRAPRAWATCPRTARSSPTSPCAQNLELGRKAPRDGRARSASRTAYALFPRLRERDGHARRRALRRRAADADALPYADGRTRRS